MSISTRNDTQRGQHSNSDVPTQNGRVDVVCCRHGQCGGAGEVGASREMVKNETCCYTGTHFIIPLKPIELHIDSNDYSSKAQSLVDFRSEG